MVTLVNALQSGDFISWLKKPRMWMAPRHQQKKRMRCYCFSTIHYETYLFVILVKVTLHCSSKWLSFTVVPYYC